MKRSEVNCTWMTHCTASCCFLHPPPPLSLPHRDFKAMGVTGTGPVLMRALESWVTDIYSNQMHQVGTSPSSLNLLFSFLVVLTCCIQLYSLLTSPSFFLDSIPLYHLMVVSSLTQRECLLPSFFFLSYVSLIPLLLTLLFLTLPYFTLPYLILPLFSFLPTATLFPSLLITSPTLSSPVLYPYVYSHYCR